MAQPRETRIPLHCHCCGRETLAELVITPKGRKVVIIAQRHGKKHCVALALPSLAHEKHRSTIAGLTT